MIAPVREVRRLLAAVQYFTRVPVPGWVGHDQALLDDAVRYLPAVGLLVGAAGAAVLVGVAAVASMPVAVSASLIATALLTGAFHEDGLADTADGLGGAADAVRAMQIMKDSRIGTYGAMALVLALLFKFATLSSMPVRTAAMALIAAHAVSRLAAVAIMATLPYVRESDDSRSKPLVRSVSGIAFAVALITGLCAVAPRGRRGRSGERAVRGGLAAQAAPPAKGVHGRLSGCRAAGRRVPVLRGLRGVAMSARVVLVRHTRPAVPPGICYGRTDLELAASWRADIAACLATVPAATRVLSSPAQRCRTLARALGRRDGVPVQVDDRLQELDFGRWEGRSWSEIPREDVDRWAADLLDYAPGAGESLRMLWARVQRWRQDVLDGREESLVVVSHHGPIRALVAQSTRQPPERMFTLKVPWGGVLWVDLPGGAP